MQTARKLNAQIIELERALALTKVQFARLTPQQRTIDEIATYTHGQVQKELNDFLAPESGPVSGGRLVRLNALLERNTELATGKGASDPSSPEQQAFNDLIEKMRPEIAEDVLAVTRGRGNIFQKA